MLLLLACAASETDTAPKPSAECDDGLTCTDDTTDEQGRCIHAAAEACEWPASIPPDVTALAGLETNFRISLSGATWNPVDRALWVVRGDGATAWRLVEDGDDWRIDGEWSLGSIDAESIVLSDPAGAPELVHVMIELDEVIMAFDLSGADAEEVRTWDTTEWLRAKGTSGSEGMTFVSDAALASWGFVDGDGAPRTSTLGHGGLFFTGTQNGGVISVFDLSDTDDQVDFVGEYTTTREDISALEFDPSTGRLYIWHGGDDNDLEVVRLSSTESGGVRSFEVEAVFDYPGDDNLEGFAIMGVEDCVDGLRPLVFTMDDGANRALDVYADWPLCEGY